MTINLVGVFERVCRLFIGYFGVLFLLITFVIIRSFVDWDHLGNVRMSQCCSALLKNGLLNALKIFTLVI